MEAVVHQALGDIFLADAGSRLERADIDDALMRYGAVGATIEHWVVRFETLGDVVGTKNGKLGGFTQTTRPHHFDVGPGDWQDRGGAIGCRRDRTALFMDASNGRDHVVGDVGRQVRLDADGAHAGATATVGNAECFVQVEVRDVATKIARAGKADLGVHVGAVDIHLAAMLMHDGASFAHTLLEHAVGRGVGEHDRRQSGAVLFGFGTQVVKINVALVVAFHHHHFHLRHGGRGGVGAVGGAGNQAYIAMPFTLGGLVAANGHQPNVFALGAGVGLHREVVVAGDFHQEGGQFVDHLHVADGLILRHEGV